MDELHEARRELEGAYQLFNWATDPRVIDEAVHRIRVAELRLDRITHPAPREAYAQPC